MGEIVLAAKITHVPSIWLSLQPGKHHGIRAGAEKALKEVARRARERGADTYVIADTHWMNTIGFHLNGKARHSGSYASQELPHFIRDLAYDYPGAPELAGLIGEEIRRIGEAIGRAVRRGDHRVAFLASGSLSHAFPANEVADTLLNDVSTELNRQMDNQVLAMWTAGRVSEFLDLLPDYNQRGTGEAGMVDTAMLFGLLGWKGYRGRGEQLCDYFGSTGTGQVVVDFELPAPRPAPSRGG
jgi:3,4-dihydroxyphenylacetate 2,3-dioxygenase